MPIDDNMQLLQQLTSLCRRYGTDAYVLGGGGNVSVKNNVVMWIKPSGAFLKDMTPDSFAQIDRRRLQKLYQMTPPNDWTTREALVRETMASASNSPSSLRPSVETPLHDSLNARFVVHTHPTLVNGMTCAKDGAEVVKRLFPDALWLDYIDPGYTLCIEVRQAVGEYARRHGHEPSIMFLQNHGVIIAEDTPEEVDRLYDDMIAKIKTEYQKADISLDLSVNPMPAANRLAEAKEKMKQIFANNGFAHMVFSGRFAYARGPITPDHIVYAKTFPFVGEPTAESVDEFIRKHGYTPRVIIWDDIIAGLGTTPTRAQLALAMCHDGALIEQLAQAFGGISYMSSRAYKFIEDWEAESYRSALLK
ncbi:MAG: class II aldolase/adducin family protein [Sedimentisphaerales bacterium]|nr:class II aldolase/adducin family protein [Sedimentisphaerales bacterium]